MRSLGRSPERSKQARHVVRRLRYWITSSEGSAQWKGSPRSHSRMRVQKRRTRRRKAPVCSGVFRCYCAPVRLARRDLLQDVGLRRRRGNGDHRRLTNAKTCTSPRWSVQRRGRGPRGRRLFAREQKAIDRKTWRPTCSIIVAINNLPSARVVAPQQPSNSGRATPQVDWLS